MGKKFSNNVDLKHVDVMESATEPDNLNSTLVDDPCNKRHVQSHKSC